MAQFYAFQVPSWELVDADLPLQGVTITRALSTPKALDASLERRYAHLETSGNVPIIREWGTVIVADLKSRIDVFIVDGISSEGDQGQMSITAGGVASYAKDQPWLIANNAVRDALDDVSSWAKGSIRTAPHSGLRSVNEGWVRSTDSINAVEVDPLNMVRAIWTMLLSAPRADLRLTIDDTTSPVRIGEEERDVEFETGDGDDVEFTAGPYKLTWHGTDDVGKEIDDLAEETPFEWVEESQWNGDFPDTHIRIGHPTIGATRKDNLFFEVGTNVIDVSGVEWTDHADVVLVTGQGEGSDKVRSHMSEATDRLRRVHVEADTSISSRTRAQERARKLLEEYTSQPVIDSITVKDTRAARFGSFDIGDIITVRGSVGWADLDDDYRIVSIAHDLTDDVQELSLEEVDNG